jgi:hypothetical protein
VRRKWFVLPVFAALATLAVVALLVWLGVEDARWAARQEALLDARIRDARSRVYQAGQRHARASAQRDEELRNLRAEIQRNEDDKERAIRAYGKATEDVARAGQDYVRAEEEERRLVGERRRRQNSWPALLRKEIRRRTGW